MANLSFFWILLMQASQFGVGLVAAAMTCAVVLLPERRDLARLLILPALWILPLALAAVFYEEDMKSADWVGYIIWPMLSAYFSVAIWASMTLPRRRVIVSVCALINAPFAFLSALVVGMAAGGAWL